MIGRVALVVAGVVLGCSLAHAQPPGHGDPDWPCQQIKVPQLSLAAVWSGPDVDTSSTAWRNDPTISDVVAKIAPRRVPIEAAQALIDGLARKAGDRKQAELLLLLAGVFSVLDQDRGSVLAGLDRFGVRQKELAARIRDESEKLRGTASGPAADAKAAQALSQQINWDVELFQDRRQSISYACDVPTEIEQRLFALARVIRQHLE